MNSEVNGFLRAQGQAIVNGQGQEVLLRGVGLGSWLLPEGYMWRFPEQGDRPRKMEHMIRQLIGEEKAQQFWELYYTRFITELDIRQIAREGFNSIRIPLSYRFLRGTNDTEAYDQRHLEILDQVLDWCETYSLYAILDLHGAPGGQTGTNIDDSARDEPELFTVAENKRRTIELWRMLAARYRDRWIVAGYDLLNEPLPDWFSQYYQDVMPLYREIVSAIRDVDPRHMIILEGVHWSTDWSIFTERIDDNLMLQFHKYWNNPDVESIEQYLAVRETWNVPIFMGEGGENNKLYYTGLFQLLEDRNISWNFWTWKKLETTNSPCSIRKPEGWGELVHFLEGGEQPDAERAAGILWDYLDNMLLPNCEYHSDVVRALFRRPSVQIPAVFYDYLGEGVSYGVRQACWEPAVNFRTKETTRLQFCHGEPRDVNFHHGAGEDWREDEWLCVVLTAGDYLTYSFQTTTQARSGLQVAVQVKGGRAEFQLAVDGQPLETHGIATSSWQTVTSTITPPLPAGKHQLRVTATDGELSIKWLAIDDRADPHRQIPHNA